MDLRSASCSSSPGRSWVFALVALLLCMGFAGGTSASESTRDYLTFGSSPGGQLLTRVSVEAASSASKTGAAVRYQAFDGEIYDLYENPGRYVNVLLPGPAGPGSPLTSDHVEELVDRLDLLYLDYRDLLQLEPEGKGLLTIAFVPQTCGTGCGLLGHKGIEITSEPWMYEILAEELDAGNLAGILVHEMVHNFDAYSNYLHYLPDHAHAWTDFMEFFGPYRYARNGVRNETPDEIYDSPVSHAWKNYLSNDAAGWENCVKHSACGDQGLEANQLWAMIYYRIESIYGVGAVRDSFDYLSEYLRTQLPPSTVQGKEDLRILSLAEGAQSNIACHMDALRWPVSQSIRNEMSRRFGSGDALCDDKDGDGFSLISGDCDDNDIARNSFSPEIAANGRDDDCDHLVDEVVLVESDLGPGPDNFLETVKTQLPFEVRGNAASSGDIDEFQFPMSSTGRVRVELCASDPFQGWAVALRPDGRFVETSNWFAYQSVPGCISESLDYEALSEGGLGIIPDDSDGDYSIQVSEADTLSPDLSVYLEAQPRPGGGVTIRLHDRDGLLARMGAEEVEFWVSQAGIRVSHRFSSSMSFDLTRVQFPQLVDGLQYVVRMRPRAEGVPLTAFSDGHAFPFHASQPQVQIDHRFSGAWFDPEHDGEGFVVEVLADDRALVYWFTFDRDGSQRWMLGVGQTRGNRLVIDDLLETRGGRFGDAFDPSEVVMRSVGSVSIAFDSCSRGVANYSVDGRGGSQSLQRLTSLVGHGCADSDQPIGTRISGSWYDPSHDGEGFAVQQIGKDDVVAFWFTYDADGNQSWLMATGSLSGNRAELLPVVQPVGGVFGRSFDPSTVTREAWGQLTLELGCAGGSARYETEVEGYSNGLQSLSPLTRLASSACGN